MVVSTVEVVDRRVHVHQGKTWVFKIIFKDSSNTVVDLTVSGYVARMQARESFASATTIVDLDSAGKGGITLSAAGEITITITDETSAAFTAPLLGVWEVELETPAGEVLPLVSGEFKIEAEVVK